MSHAKIQSDILTKFEAHRVVFWYDRKREFRAVFESLVLEGITLLEINNNELQLKARILREEPRTRFLLYHEGAPPADAEHWLLDCVLAFTEFKLDQDALWRAELGWGTEYSSLTQTHPAFFRDAKRVNALKGCVSVGEPLQSVRLKMMAVCMNAEPTLEEVLLTCLATYAETNQYTLPLLTECALDAFWWERVGVALGYNSQQPNLKDFTLKLFHDALFEPLGISQHLNREALLFFARWQTNRLHETAFRHLAEQFVQMQTIDNKPNPIDDRLNTAPLETVLTLHAVPNVDRRILRELQERILRQDMTLKEMEDLIRKRRGGVWFKDFEALYHALEAALGFFTTLDQVDWNMKSAPDALRKYAQHSYQVDTHYREYHQHVIESGQHSFLESLTQTLDTQYRGKFLIPLNEKWQRFVDAMTRWEVDGVPNQRDFFQREVQPIIERGNKIYVIISDAFRYEVGVAFKKRLEQENRYEVTVTPWLASLPSYTQLGMAALLPHTHLSIESPDQEGVRVDGERTSGLEARRQVLQTRTNGAGNAYTYDDFINLSLDKRREITRQHHVLYLYHNHIDAIGDKRDTEDSTPTAVADSLVKLVNLVKSLQNANAHNFILTADHGFLYQQHALTDEDILSEQPHGTVFQQHRRFVVGEGLALQNGFKTFEADALGIASTATFQFPKSIHRLRKQGAGGRFVHGGTSLQEVVIPMLHISKRREGEIQYVNVEVLGSNFTITTNQIPITLYQSEPVKEKTRRRVLQVGLYTREERLISDTHNLTFDFTSENNREREQQITLTLSQNLPTQAETVYLRLLETPTDSDLPTEYHRIPYTLRLSFTRDFDF